jgi:hypothetical protein
LNTFPDFVLFKGSLDNVIVEGWFDQNWRLTPGDIVKIRRHGACLIPETPSDVAVHPEMLKS